MICFYFEPTASSVQRSSANSMDEDPRCSKSANTGHVMRSSRASLQATPLQEFNLLDYVFCFPDTGAGRLEVQWLDLNRQSMAIQYKAPVQALF